MAKALDYDWVSTDVQVFLRGVEQRGLAKQLHVSRTSLQNWSKRGLLPVAVFKAICQLYPQKTPSVPVLKVRQRFPSTLPNEVVELAHAFDAAHPAWRDNGEVREVARGASSTGAGDDRDRVRGDGVVREHAGRAPDPPPLNDGWVEVMAQVLARAVSRRDQLTNENTELRTQLEHERAKIAFLEKRLADSESEMRAAYATVEEYIAGHMPPTPALEPNAATAVKDRLHAKGLHTLAEEIDRFPKLAGLRS